MLACVCDGVQEAQHAVALAAAREQSQQAFDKWMPTVDQQHVMVRKTG